MSQARVLGIVGLLALTAAAVAYAQTTVNPVPENTPVQAAPLNTAPEKVVWGDAKAGATKAGTCAACHGLDGNPTTPAYPRLAGQNERFIARQLALFKSGERNTGMAAVMKPFADALTAQDARDIGAYFATQRAGAGVADDTLITRGPNAGKKFFQVGEQLFRNGDKARSIPACMACHGPAGSGNPGPAYPHLAGQQAAYTQRRLEEYRAGTTAERDPHLFFVMAAVTRQLTDEEIGSLASFLQGLHPSREDIAAANAPAPVAAPAPAAPAPAPAAAPAPAEQPPAATPASGT
ncbi:c-type cytochrome [Lysobacter sp. LF1]|uniref:C-type cytochrome n=1 Tax=Lysobacter stagni TaxID=3045172 RepID=A0ABT6XCG3_9GAMM|nr:c-type cytochrome [Lysobacter sp. LF1]MDI9237831.1 c-type cytochrome [Lysobacter sp. LF1]